MQLNTKKLARLSLFIAITILLAATPLGYIPINPLLSVTIMTVPITIAGVLLGPSEAVLLSVIFGITSFSRASFESAFSIALMAKSIPLTFFACIVPRLLVGISAAFIGAFIRARHIKNMLAYALAGAACSFVNTFFFIAALYLGFSELTGGLAIFALVLSSGIPEALAAAVICSAVIKALSRYMK